MRVIFIFLLGVTTTLAFPSQDDGTKIVGGTVTTIDQYPFGVALLTSASGSSYAQSCGGSILNNRSVLTAAHCFLSRSLAWQWRSRVGSTWSNSGGTVYDSLQIIIHPNFSRFILDMDFAILRIVGTFEYSPSVAPASIAGPNYNVADSQSVWAIGWGTTCSNCAASEQLQHVEVWTVNQAICVDRYRDLFRTVTNNMLCSGWLDVGGRDQCQGDSGGPLLHNNVVVGVCSWGFSCALPRFPGVNARVSSASNWLVENA